MLAWELKVLALTLTNRCNLKCVHCGRENQPLEDRQEMSIEFFLDLISEAKQMGAIQLNITGGEIFCRLDCLQLIGAAYDLGYFVSIETNGTLLTDAHLNELAEFSDRLRISISLDGFSAEVHDKIRGQGMFNKTMSVIDKVVKQKIPARIITLLHEDNSHQIMELAKYFVNDQGIGFRLLPSILEYGRGVYACNTHGLTFQKMNEVLQQYYNFLRQKKTEGMPDEMMSVELNVALVPLDIQNHHLCAWGRAMIGVSPNGLASLCHVSYHHPQFVFGDLKKQSLVEIWEKSPQLLRFRRIKGNEMKGVCGNCLANEVCKGGCRLHAISKYNNDFLAPDPQCQVIYDLGYFPKHALNDESMDCSYLGEK